MNVFPISLQDRQSFQPKLCVPDNDCTRLPYNKRYVHDNYCIDNYVYCIDNYVQSIDNNVFEKFHRQVYDNQNNGIDLNRAINNHRYSQFHSIE